MSAVSNDLYKINTLPAVPASNAKGNPLPCAIEVLQPAEYPAALKPWTAWKITKIVIAVVIFPIGLLWLANKVLCIALWALFNKIMNCCADGRGLIDGPLLPALGISKDPQHLAQVQMSKANFHSDPDNDCTSIKFMTPDGVKIDGSILWSKWCDPTKLNDAATMKASRWIVFFNPNAMPHAHISDELRKLYPYDEFNIIAFDYRGVIDSEGYPDSATDWTLDGCAAVNFLQKLGVSNGNIYLEGWSLGGGVSAQVGAVYPGVNVGNIQSFSSIKNLMHTVTYRYFSETKRWSSCISSVLAWLISTIAGHILWTQGWELNSQSAWGDITGKKRIETADDDHLMIGNGRLANALGMENASEHVHYPGDHCAHPNRAAMVMREEYFRS